MLIIGEGLIYLDSGDGILPVRPDSISRLTASRATLDDHGKTVWGILMDIDGWGREDYIWDPDSGEESCIEEFLGRILSKEDYRFDWVTEAFLLCRRSMKKCCTQMA